jgi:preprotein translocase subunit SecF
MRLLKIIPDNTNIGFVRIRHIAFAITALLTVAALALVFARGLNMGVDFVGGVSIEEKFVTAPPLDEVRSTVNRLGLGEAALQQLGGANTVTIRLPSPESTDPAATDQMVEKVKAALAAKFPGATFTNYATVSSKVSDDLKWNGTLAVLLAIVTLGFFALTQLVFDLNIVAAVLTIIGYSINDKMVIDDRIRENMRKFRKMDMRDLIDLSVNETLPRTVMTSLTIMLALAALLIFGGHVLRGFTAAMMLGIVVGTYSSIYVSSSLLISLGLKPGFREDRKEAAANNAERIGPREG